MELTLTYISYDASSYILNLAYFPINRLLRLTHQYLLPFDFWYRRRNVSLETRF